MFKLIGQKSIKKEVRYSFLTKQLGLCSVVNCQSTLRLMEDAMRKLLILLAVFVFIVAFTVPAMAAPRASPIPVLNDWMIMPTAMAASTAPATSNLLMTLRVTPRAMATATTFTKSDRMWNQVVAFNVNYNYHGKLTCLPGALVSDEEIFLVSAKVSENKITATLVSFAALTGNPLTLAVHNPTAASVVDVVGMNDLMRHGQTNTEYDLAGNTVQNENSIIIQVRSISILPVCFAPVAYCKANEFSFGQRAAYCGNLTNMAIIAQIGDTLTITGKSTVLRR